LGYHFGILVVGNLQVYPLTNSAFALTTDEEIHEYSSTVSCVEGRYSKMSKDFFTAAIAAGFSSLGSSASHQDSRL
jgi:hypothetical protein